MRRIRRSYEKPLRPWDKSTIENHKKIKQDYGLRRKKEILRAESILRNYRRIARELAANRDNTKEEILLTKLRKLGLVDESASLDDVLALTLEAILDRRLQTIIVRKGLATTPKQARQFIVHGHIALDGRRSKWPSTLVPLEKETEISFYHRSKVKETVLKKLEKPIEESKEVKKEVDEEPKIKEVEEKDVKEAKQEKLAEVPQEENKKGEVNE